jgi:hypothetical protein
VSGFRKRSDITNMYIPICILRKTNNLRYVIKLVYRVVLNFVDQFTALRFTAIGAPPDEGLIQFLSMNQQA